MLDGRDQERKSYTAVRIYETEVGRESKMTMHFTAFDDADAQRFLLENGYQEYKLMLTEG